MKLIYAVKDTAVQAFGQMIEMRAPGEMLRSLQDETNRKDKATSAIAAHPDDYELYQLGTYDEQTGKLTALPEPLLITRCKDLITQGE